jgi:hypothetical protein
LHARKQGPMERAAASTRVAQWPDHGNIRCSSGRVLGILRLTFDRCRAPSGLSYVVLRCGIGAGDSPSSPRPCPQPRVCFQLRIGQQRQWPTKVSIEKKTHIQYKTRSPSLAPTDGPHLGHHPCPIPPFDPPQTRSPTHFQGGGRFVLAPRFCWKFWKWLKRA